MYIFVGIYSVFLCGKLNMIVILYLKTVDCNSYIYMNVISVGVACPNNRSFIHVYLYTDIALNNYGILL